MAKKKCCKVGKANWHVVPRADLRTLTVFMATEASNSSCRDDFTNSQFSVTFQPTNISIISQKKNKYMWKNCRFWDLSLY